MLCWLFKLSVPQTEFFTFYPNVPSLVIGAWPSFQIILEGNLGMILYSSFLPRWLVLYQVLLILFLQEAISSFSTLIQIHRMRMLCFYCFLSTSRAQRLANHKCSVHHCKMIAWTPSGMESLNALFLRLSLFTYSYSFSGLSSSRKPSLGL